MKTSNSETGRHRHGGPGGRRRFGKKMIAIPFIMAAFIAIKSVVVFFLWNALIPDLFHGPEITYLQALGLSVLVKVLVGFGGGRGFGGMRGHHFGRGGFDKHLGGKGGPWGFMSPEDRERLREEIQKRRGYSENEADGET